MTESYDPYANAVAKRVNGILKQEFGLETFDADTRKQWLTVDKEKNYLCGNL